MCLSCWKKKRLEAPYGLYIALQQRQREFNQPITYTFLEFYHWLQGTHYDWLENQYRRLSKKLGRSSRAEKPSIDRINNWMDYDLRNLQVLTVRDNCVKNDKQVVAALEPAMRIFKKLRKKVGLTKYHMAKHLGMLPQTYFYLEDKAQGCSFEILCLVKEKLQLSWEELGSLVEEEVKFNAKAKKELKKEL